MKKPYSIALVAIILLASSSYSYASNQTPFLQNAFQGIDIGEEGGNGNLGWVPNIAAISDKTFFCKDLDDAICSAASSIYATSLLPPCDSIITRNCIENVFAIDPNGSKTFGEFIKYVPDRGDNDFAANEGLNLPQGRGQGGVWKIPGANFDDGEPTYFVSAGVQHVLQKSTNSKITTQKFFLNSLSVEIAPVREITGKYKANFAIDANWTGGGIGVGNNSQDHPCSGTAVGICDLADPYPCVVTAEGICELRKNYPANFRFGLTLNLGGKIKEWFHGRIFQPVISVKSIGIDDTQIQIEASPVTVPLLHESIPTSQISQELRDYLTNGPSFGYKGGIGNAYVMPGSDGVDALEISRLWMPLVQDKATRSKSFWRARTLLGNQGSLQNCDKNTSEVAGIISTNALVYSAGPPEFNLATQTLDYKVLSPHFLQDGSETSGTYDLIIRSSIARCIYKFSDAPVKASISLIDSSGEKKIFTESFTESDGWMRFSVSGFTFSNPIVRVKLTQAAPAPSPTPSPTPTVTATPSASATPTPSAPPVAKKVTITCIKGKSVKKVTAVKPVCPKGYKKK